MWKWIALGALALALGCEEKADAQCVGGRCAVPAAIVTQPVSYTFTVPTTATLEVKGCEDGKCATPTVVEQTPVVVQHHYLTPMHTYHHRRRAIRYQRFRLFRGWGCCR